MDTKCRRCFRPRIENLTICAECQRRALERATKNKHQCKWITKTDGQCSIRTDKSLNYCKRHSEYEELVKPEEISELKECSCCIRKRINSEFIRNTQIFKTCNECEERRLQNVANKNINKIKCSVDNCPNNTIDNNQYCLLHINYIKKDDTMCSNDYCYDLIEQGYKQCAKCRAKERSKYNTIENRLRYYIKNCKYENKIWELSNDDAKKLFLEECHYCGKIANKTNFNGIDRKMPNEPYKLNNCVPCCETCNFMKQQLNYNDFINIIHHLAFKYDINDNIENEDYELFKFPLNVTYSKYQHGALERKLEFTLTKENFDTIIIKDCHYCKSSPVKYSGIDRFDNNKGYTLDNCVACCTTCNFLKHTLSYDDFIIQIKKIYNHLNNIIINETIEDNIEEKLIRLFTNGSLDINPYQEKFNYDDQYYLNMLFDGKLDEIKKIKIKLEFVENSEQRDIWNFYRARLSSFRKNVENKKNGMGKRIFILIKDETSNKYLGILGLSSDYASVSGRDKYIEWSKDMKFEDKLLNKLFNIMMCVPSTVFGYNFCGGKLLAKLCYSKEVIQYYYDKYQDIPLGISTMSIYGKSIQYDRIPELKFVGYSSGKGLKSYSNETLELSRQYLLSQGIDVNKLVNQTHPTAKIIGKTLSMLGLCKDEYMYHHVKRGVYFGELFKDSLKILRKEVDNNITETNINTLRSVDTIYNEWFNKYAMKRYTHLLTESRLIKINKLLWSKQYKIFERNNKYKVKKIIPQLIHDTEPDKNINIISSSENNEIEKNQNIITTEKEENIAITKKKKFLSEESKMKISESKRNKNKKYGIETDKKILNTLMNSITGKQLAIELSTPELTLNEKYVQRIRSDFVKKIVIYKQENSDIKSIIQKLKDYYTFDIKKECVLCAITLYKL